MYTKTRRHFLFSISAVAAAVAAGFPVRAAMGPNDKFDLVVKGGTVLDPSQKLNAKRDIGMRFGVIEAIEADIPGGARTAGARRNGSHRVARPDRSCIRMSSLMVPRSAFLRTNSVPIRQCDRGVSGRRRANNFAIFPSSHSGSNAHAAVRVRAHREHRVCRVSRYRSSSTSTLQSRRCGESSRENADIVIGIKVSMSENVIAKHGLEPLRRSIRACDLQAPARK
jgi:dihydroorotase